MEPSTVSLERAPVIALQVASSPLAEKSTALPDCTERLDYPSTLSGQFIWTYVGAFVLLHASALLVLWPWLFSWVGAILLPLGVHVFGGVGISVCYHRLLAHRAFRTPKWVEYVFATMAVCCMQDTPARWVAIHRKHHQKTDEQEDPHSPLVSFFWGHFGWLLVENEAVCNFGFYDKYARDILRDPYYFFLERNFVWLGIYAAHAVLYFAAGFGLGYLWTYEGMDPMASGLRLGLSVVVWGVLLRTVIAWHITWSVNSIGHLWGYRNYSTADHSRNHAWLGVISSGEGWHNNHHADPRCAKLGHRWWEIDSGWWTIALLEKCGLADEIVAEPRTKGLEGGDDH